MLKIKIMKKAVGMPVTVRVHNSLLEMLVTWKIWSALFFVTTVLIFPLLFY